MKRKLTVTIDIDTDRDQRPNSRAYLTYPWSDPDAKVIRIGAGSGSDPQVLATLLAHELGHLVGQVLGLPGAMSDPRATRNTVNENEGACVVASEVEAWNYAARMIRATFQQQREFALGSYERDYNVKATNLEEV